MTQHEPFARRRAPGLDAIRILAIGLVLAHHFRKLPGASEAMRWFGLRGYVGVDLFFVLSGWLIGGQLFRELGRSGRVDTLAFWRRRWLRTLPAGLAVLALLVLFDRVPLRALPAMLLWVQNYLAPDVWVVSWSLCVEEQFYFVLPLLVPVLAWLHRRGPRLALLAIATVALASLGLRSARFPWIVGTDYVGFIQQYYVVTHLRLDGLAVGVGMAAAVEWRTGLAAFLYRFAGPAAVVGTVLVATPWIPALGGATGDPAERMQLYNAVFGFTFVSIGTALWLPLATRVNVGTRTSAALAWSADLAYGLYLTHEFAGEATLRLLAAWRPPFLPTLTFAVALSVLFAMLIRVLVERPVLAWRDRTSPPRHTGTQG